MYHQGSMGPLYIFYNRFVGVISTSCLTSQNNLRAFKVFSPSKQKFGDHIGGRHFSSSYNSTNRRHIPWYPSAWNIVFVLQGFPWQIQASSLKSWVLAQRKWWSECTKLCKIVSRFNTTQTPQYEAISPILQISLLRRNNMRLRDEMICGNVSQQLSRV